MFDEEKKEETVVETPVALPSEEVEKVAVEGAI